MDCKPESKIGLLQKITNFTIGFLINALIFGLIFKVMNGGWTGAVAATAFGAATAIIVLKKFKAEPLKKIIGTGILASTVVLAVVPLILWIILYVAYGNIAS